MCRYPPSTIHRYLVLPSTQRIQTHTAITPPHGSRPCPSPLSKPPTHSQPTPPTPPQPKHRHMSNTPPVPTGLVMPKPNSLIHLPHSPPTSPRAKHIHMSHTPLTPPTTLITSTSPVLDKTPEPRVPLMHALTATKPPQDPTPALQSPSHPHTLTAHTHATQTTVHVSQSSQQLHSHIGYYDILTNRPRTTTGLPIPLYIYIYIYIYKPSSPLKPKHPKYITSQQCAPIGCTRQEVGSLHSLETTSHSLQQTYLRLLIHTTQKFKWSRYTLTTLNISQ